MLKNEIERVLEKFYIEGWKHEVTFRDGVDQTLASILELIEKYIPEKRKILKYHDNQQWFNEGYNFAIDNIQEKIKSNVKN